jgi:hypothetical protein
MRFFTQELLQRFGSDDDRVALQAQEQLERRSEQYARHLKKVESKLPARFLELQRNYYLHDARIISPWFLDVAFSTDWMERTESKNGRGRQPTLLLVLQLDTPSKEVLVLHYRSVLLEELNRHASLQKETFGYLEWRHDEIDVVGANGVNYVSHSILFTSGWELRIQFRDFDFAVMSPLAEGSPPKQRRPRKAAK